MTIAAAAAGHFRGQHLSTYEIRLHQQQSIVVTVVRRTGQFYPADRLEYWIPARRCWFRNPRAMAAMILFRQCCHRQISVGGRTAHNQVRLNLIELRDTIFSNSVNTICIWRNSYGLVRNGTAWDGSRKSVDKWTRQILLISASGPNITETSPNNFCMEIHTISPQRTPSRRGVDTELHFCTAMFPVRSIRMSILW